MASMLGVRRVLASSNLRCASTRRFYSHSPFEAVLSHLGKLAESLSPCVVSVASFFYGSDDRKVPHSCRGGNGVFLSPTLILTSAHIVGRVDTVYESRTREKRHRFEQGSVLYKSYIGSTAALTAYKQTLKTRPLAVYFVNDVALLEVVNPNPEGTNSLAHCGLANSPPYKENLLLNISQGQDYQLHVTLGKVRAVGEKTIRAKAPWPMDDELGWIEHEWGGVDPLPGSILLNSREKVTGSITRNIGSPWFNLNGEVAGISSWEVRDEPFKFLRGFAVPPLSIRSVLDYAKTKRPEDPIVMDRWISSHVIPED